MKIHVDSRSMNLLEVRVGFHHDWPDPKIKGKLAGGEASDCICANLT